VVNMTLLREWKWAYHEITIPYSRLFTTYRLIVHKFVTSQEKGNIEGGHISHCFSLKISMVFYLLFTILLSLLQLIFLSSLFLTSSPLDYHSSFSHILGDPHFTDVAPPLAPPVCKAGVSQDKEDSNYLTKKATGS